MTKGLRVTVHAATDVGRVREGNEDSYYAGNTVFAVADGMGGHQAGEVASRTALEPIAELDGQMFATGEDASEAIVEAITAANQAVIAEGDADPSLAGMGTTLTAAVLRDGRIHIAHVGDSRAYLVRNDGSISQITTDHTLVEQLVQDGRLTRDDAAKHPQRSVITRAIGVEREVQPDRLPPIELEPGDQVLLCSDGLTGPVDDATIIDLLAEEDGDAACQALIDAANEGGGTDNITVVLLRVSGSRTDATGPLATTPAATAPAADEDGMTDANTTTETLPPAAPAPEEPAGPEVPTTQIRTRTDAESSEDWARRMGHLGEQQGADGSGPSMRPERSSRRGRVAAVLLGIVLLLGLLAGGGYALLSRAFYVGELDGEVAIYNGIPQNVAGIPLHWVREADSGVRIDDLPQFRAERVREGVTAASLIEAREIVESLRELAEDDEAEEPEPTPDPDDTTDDPDATDGADTTDEATAP